jgi:phage terminase large subunit GpA-like protein
VSPRAQNLLNPLDDIRQCLVPPPKYQLADWCEENFILSEYSAQRGLLKLDLFQRDMFNAYTDERVNKVVLMTSTQLTKTLFIQAAIAYSIVCDPGPILVSQYKDTDAERFSHERIAPMIRDIAQLRALIGDPKSRDSRNTTTHKMFPGGSLDLVGSLSSANFARRTIRYMFFDEVDLYESSSTGDPIALGIRRTERFGSRAKIIMACSPTDRGTSRIGKAYEESDQRKPYVRCPYCDFAQILVWSNVIWDKDHGQTVQERANSAQYLCGHCREPWTEAQRRESCRTTLEWRAHAPFNGVAGFWVNHLYSGLPAHSLSSLALEWLNCVDERQGRKDFINTHLAELWEEEGERPDHYKLMAQAEDYRMGQDCTVPAKAVFLTAGADIHPKRIECQVLAHGPDDNTWAIDYEVIELFEPNGAPKMTSAPEYQAALREILNREYRHASGVRIPIIAMAVDMGHNPDFGYEFSKQFPQPSYGSFGVNVVSPRTVICIQGYDLEHMNAIHSYTTREAARQRKGASQGRDLPIVKLGTGYLKQKFYSAVHSKDVKRIHLPRWQPEEYFRQLTAERRVTIGTRVTWRKEYPRGEALDTWVYADGARACFRGDKFGDAHWQRIRDKFGIRDVAVDEDVLVLDGVEVRIDPAKIEAPASKSPARTGFRPVIGRLKI